MWYFCYLGTLAILIYQRHTKKLRNTKKTRETKKMKKRKKTKMTKKAKKEVVGTRKMKVLRRLDDKKLPTLLKLTDKENIDLSFKKIGTERRKRQKNRF